MKLSRNSQMAFYRVWLDRTTSEIGGVVVPSLKVGFTIEVLAQEKPEHPRSLEVEPDSLSIQRPEHFDVKSIQELQDVEASETDKGYLQYDQTTDKSKTTTVIDGGTF